MRHSKGEVNRAGALFAEWLSLVLEKGQVADAPGEVLNAARTIQWWRAGHARPLSRVGANLHRYAEREGRPIVAQRLKRFPTIAGKLLREPGMKLSRMADIGGVRAVLPDQRAAYRVARQLRRNWTITQFRDYVAEPKPDGYRALHLINRNRGRLIEIQLRTPGQDVWANAVERLDRTVAAGLKFGGGPLELRDRFLIVAEILAKLDQGLPITHAEADAAREALDRIDIFVATAAYEP